MKTLLTCNLREFVRQIARIREAAGAWLAATRLLELRRRLPEPREYKDDDEHRAAIMGQWRSNIRAMLDAVLIEHPDETAELLGLLCFIEPEDLDKHPMKDVFEAVVVMLLDDNLMQLLAMILTVGLTPEKVTILKGGGSDEHDA